MPEPYKPLSCSQYDVLESAALLKTPLILVLENTQLFVMIKDVFAKGSEEFLKAEEMKTRTEHLLRLDKIRQIIDPVTNRNYSSDQC
jgi:transcriptional antiterminator Rof (Rho-off)